MSHSPGAFAPLFKALSDETRLRIVAMLSDGELCACHILEALDISQPTLSYHMKLLRGCGLVHGRKDGAWMRYTINEACFEQLGQFLQQIRWRRTLAHVR